MYTQTLRRYLPSQIATFCLTFAALSLLDPSNAKATRSFADWAFPAKVSLFLLPGFAVVLHVICSFFVSTEITKGERCENTEHKSQIDDTRVTETVKIKFRRPSIAWPTVFLAIGSVLGFFGSVWFGHRCNGSMARLAAMFTSAVSIFLCFTPLHEAVHSSVQ